MLSRFARSFLAIILALVLLTTFAMLHPPSRAYMSWNGDLYGEGGVEQDIYHVDPLKSGVSGGVIMSKLGNETAKSELGRATWKLLHTMTLRYPEDPAQDERDALDAYFRLSARLYPCGECAAEFQMLLKKFPPQTSSRRSAANWLCFLHNQVNERLLKPEFDCAHLDATYDCGCGDAPIATTKPAGRADSSDPMDLERDTSKDDLTGAGLIKGGR
ncbi:hypothetical protein FIBSPDRAFT_797519 [Athelia psychrophila]|uniref:Sulfhydryl oxidase n=1 Tax=Athelia psychrophila TaxID=1759441 RepID=A0A166CKA2_9AGAM|nr:hypothetical protein FIBSPDRAFT_797519 [Fibularhizoctonia sp. CBS 109695]